MAELETQDLPSAGRNDGARKIDAPEADNGAAAGHQIYQKAVRGGEYDLYTGGLSGKHDNVRRYWEDHITRAALRPFMRELAQTKERQLERIRILDFGSGSGEGYALLTAPTYREAGLRARASGVFRAEQVGLYRGVDLSPAMAEQGRTNYAGNPKVVFDQGNLSEGLPVEPDEPPYDVYFSSYGPLSHMPDAQVEELLVQTANHAQPGALVVLDLLGRYSYEWPSKWPGAGYPVEGMDDYAMSWLYEEEARRNGEVEVEVFPMRYWSKPEVETLLEAVSDRAKRRLVPLHFVDRSMFVGRHTDTREYNPFAQPIREVVNSLHEDNVRTDLERLIVDFVPIPGFPDKNRAFERLCVAWNVLVHHAMVLLEGGQSDPPEADVTGHPEVVELGMRTLSRVVENVEWMQMGDPRTNIIEPQLGYVLRGLEQVFQQGQGLAHGLIVVVRVEEH